MKYTFSKDGNVEMVSIEVDATNVIVRPATKQDHEDAKGHEAAQKAFEAAQKAEAEQREKDDPKAKGVAVPHDDLSVADKQVVKDEADAEEAYQKKKR